MTGLASSLTASPTRPALKAQIGLMMPPTTRSGPDGGLGPGAQLGFEGGRGVDVEVLGGVEGGAATVVECGRRSFLTAACRRRHIHGRWSLSRSATTGGGRERSPTGRPTGPRGRGSTRPPRPGWPLAANATVPHGSRRRSTGRCAPRRCGGHIGGPVGGGQHARRSPSLDSSARLPNSAASAGGGHGSRCRWPPSDRRR